VAGPGELAAASAAVRGVRVTPEVAGYIVDLCRATRQSPSLRLACPRAAPPALQATSRAWAWLAGRDYVTPDDVKRWPGRRCGTGSSSGRKRRFEGASADGVARGGPRLRPRTAVIP